MNSSVIMPKALLFFFSNKLNVHTPDLVIDIYSNLYKNIPPFEKLDRFQTCFYSEKQTAYNPTFTISLSAAGQLTRHHFLLRSAKSLGTCTR